MLKLHFEQGTLLIPIHALIFFFIAWFVLGIGIVFLTNDFTFLALFWFAKAFVYFKVGFIDEIDWEI